MSAITHKLILFRKTKPRKGKTMYQSDSSTPTGTPVNAHSFIDPITSVKLLSEVLRDYPQLDADQRHQFLDMILNSTDRLIRLVNRMPEESICPVGAAAS